MVPLKRKTSLFTPMTMTQQYLANYHMNSILSDALGVEFHPRHFSETRLDLDATYGNEEDNSEFDLPIDLYIEDNEILLPELIQMLRIQYIDLVNQLNLAYTGPVFFGTPLQGNQDADFVYDTGSGYLTVTSTACDVCDSQYFSPGISESGRALGLKPKVLRYGSATLAGVMVADRVCLSDEEPLDVCADDFEFLVMTKSKGLNGNDGILGLSPINKANGPSFMDALYK